MLVMNVASGSGEAVVNPSLNVVSTRVSADAGKLLRQHGFLQREPAPSRITHHTLGSTGHRSSLEIG